MALRACHVILLTTVTVRRELVSLVTCAWDAISPAAFSGGADRRSAGQPGCALSDRRQCAKIGCHRGTGGRDEHTAGARSGTAAPGSGPAHVPGRGSGRADLRS